MHHAIAAVQAVVDGLRKEQEAFVREETEVRRAAETRCENEYEKLTSQVQSAGAGQRAEREGGGVR